MTYLFRKLGAGIKLAVLAVFLIPFMVSHVSGLSSALFVAVAVFFVFVGTIVILLSRLLALKKFGLFLGLLSLGLFCVWDIMSAHHRWISVRDGTETNWMLGLSFALAAGSVFFLFGYGWRGHNNYSAPRHDTVFWRGTRKLDPLTLIGRQLREIDWFQFETVTARILHADGWNVERSGGANPDGGADMLAVKDGHRTVVQCKHWKNLMVPPSVLRELLGTKASSRFQTDSAMLFTLSDCTSDALAFARENSIRVYDASSVASCIKRIGIDHFPELAAPDLKACPKCGAAMILREAAVPPFWGCTTYPRCRGKIAH